MAAATFALGCVLAHPVQAAWSPVPVAPPALDGAPRADALLVAADAAVDAAADAEAVGDRAAAGIHFQSARALYERVARDFPDSVEAVQARRALRISDVSSRATPPAAAPAGTTAASVTGTDKKPDVVAGSAKDGARAPGDVRDRIVMRKEPYSTRTSERLRLTAWEKLDFGVTSFLYGMSLGVSYAISVRPSDSSDVTLPIALGALTYTLGAVAYLNVANPDRGDLPLALAITSYLPTTVLLLSNVVAEDADVEDTSLAVAAAGLVSIPVAIATTSKLNLDPGDTQLVRDAGFWGLVLATAGTLGFGGETRVIATNLGAPPLEEYVAPSSRTVAGLGLLGLYGGLGVGILAAAKTEVSLERVRVTTWGGYGGALIGALVGAGLDNSSERDVYGGLAIGALVGLAVTFAATGTLDGIPPEETSALSSSSSSSRRARSTPFSSRWTPTMVPLRGVTGQAQPGVGLSYLLH